METAEPGRESGEMLASKADGVRFVGPADEGRVFRAGSTARLPSRTESAYIGDRRVGNRGVSAYTVRFQTSGPAVATSRSAEQ